jgi:hypothetical protein
MGKKQWLPVQLLEEYTWYSLKYVPLMQRPLHLLLFFLLLLFFSFVANRLKRDPCQQIEYTSDERRNSSDVKEEMGTVYDASVYPSMPVFVLGILGNILVIISILKQGRLLKNNYYFLVVQLAFLDLLCLIGNIGGWVYIRYVETRFSRHSRVTYCFIIPTIFLFHISEMFILLVIAFLRYRATVHPFKPAISRQKLKVMCGSGYIFATIAGYGTFTMTFFKRLSIEAYLKTVCLYGAFLIFFAPTVFMGVVYCRIGRALFKQNKFMKAAPPYPATQISLPHSVMKYIQNRRTYIACFAIVLCHGVGNLPSAVWSVWYVAGGYSLTTKYIAMFSVGEILRIASSCALNPLIYGIFDRKIRTFWALCRKERRRRYLSRVNR